MSAVLVSKRILNFTLINHPVLDEAVAEEALERFQQAVEEVWSRGLSPALDRLSPAAQRWRAEFIVRDGDAPMDRQVALLAVLAQFATNLRQNPPSPEVGRALTRGQLIYTGIENGQISWGVTADLQGMAPAEVHLQTVPGRIPGIANPAALVQALDAMRDAALSGRPAPTPEVEPRRRRLGR